MKKMISFAVLLTALFSCARPLAQNPVCDTADDNSAPVSIVRTYQAPVHIVDQGGHIANADVILRSDVTGQAFLGKGDACVMRSAEGDNAYLLLDFGRELHGGLRIVTGIYSGEKMARMRIRFGESVSEACCDIDGVNGATNDHAIRDMVAEIPWLGTREFGNTGFRFVRIDLLDCGRDIPVVEVSAIKVDSDVPQVGSFSCSDERLNEIWETGRHTVKLNMQDYIWDGIKRDRLVWIGDLYPEMMTVCSVYGATDIINRSLDHAALHNPLPTWISGMCSYSMWWVLIHSQWYRYTGQLEYLEGQREYLTGVLRQIAGVVDADGCDHFPNRFLDWPSNADTSAVATGIHALLMITMERGKELCELIGEGETAALCQETYDRLAAHAGAVRDAFLSSDTAPDAYGRKQAVSLMSLAGMVSDEVAVPRLLHNGSHGFSTFYGYFMLEALAKAGKYKEAMSLISEYWGAMLDLGATSFWEDFDISWMENAGRIDEMPVEGKVDVHKSYGGYCYQGYRHSLCHGWASGPTAWLTRYVLGLEPAEPGQTAVSVNPHLGDLEWAEGTYPTPYGPVSVRVSRRSDGGVSVVASAPKQVKLVAAPGVSLKRSRR